LAFGNVQVNTTTTTTLTISNSGNSGLTVGSITYPAGFSGAWSGTIPAGGSQPVTVMFAPTAVTSYGGTITVNANQTNGTNTISVSGTGTTPPPSSTTYYVWGGSSYTVYLGNFTCIFCTEFSLNTAENGGSGSNQIIERQRRSIDLFGS